MIFLEIFVFVWLVKDSSGQEINITISEGVTKCSTNTSKPMFFKVFNYEEFKNYQPTKHENHDYPSVYFRCDLGKYALCDDWWPNFVRTNSINSNNRMISSIIEDERWQDLELFRLGGKKYDVFTELLSNLSSSENFVIPMSWKITRDLKLCLCSAEIGNTFNCYCIELRNTTVIHLKKCSGLTLSKLKSGLSMKGCSQVETFEEYPVKWNAHTWENIYLVKTYNIIDLFHMTKPQEWYFRFTLARDFGNMKYLFAHSTQEGFLKIHNYDYLLTKTAGVHTISRPYKMNHGSICLALYVSMCTDCSMVFKMAGHSTRRITRREEKDWSYIQISFHNSVNEYEQLYFETIRGISQNVSSDYWAIDLIQLCPDERSISLPGNHTCEYVYADAITIPEIHEIDLSSGYQDPSSMSYIKCSFFPGRHMVDVIFDPFRLPLTSSGFCSHAEIGFYIADLYPIAWWEQKMDITRSNSYGNSNSMRLARMTFRYVPCVAYFLRVRALDIYLGAVGGEATIIVIPQLLPDNLIINVTDQSDHSIDFTVTNYNNFCQDDRSLSMSPNRYLLVLISNTHKSVMDYEQSEVLEEKLNMIFDKSDRVVAEYNLTQFANETIFKFTIGNGEEMDSSYLKGVLRNSPLEPSSTYKLTFVVITTFDHNQNYYIYYHNVSTNKVVHLTSDLWLIATIILIIFGITSAISWYVYNNRRRISVPNKRSGSTDDVVFISNQNQSSTSLVPSKSEDREILFISGSSMSSARSHPLKEIKKLEPRPIKTSKLEKYIRSSIKTPELEQQFNSLPRGMTEPCDCGLLETNKPKNRDNNIVPFDDTRVKLEKWNKMQNSDYINANYIKGYESQKAYIATQGPKALTINDFWQMVWQENVNNIIMLVNLEESGQKKVEKYWPNYNQDFQFGKVHVFYHAAEVLADYEIRVFKVVCDGTERKIFQYHFLRWPNQGVPVHFQTLIPFMRKTLEISSNSPIVVHCCSGTSATGVFILCHINLRRAAETGTVDPFGVAQELRKQRMNMIDNLQQYKLAHLVIMECILGLHTAISCTDDINRLVAELTSSVELKLQMAYLNEADWQNRVLIRPTEPIEAFQVFPKKNRRMDISPDCIGAINLSRYPSTDPSSAYINAVKVDGYRCPERYIVTQQPMPNTLSDFWRMVVQDNIQAIISLNDINLKEKKSCSFWPTEENPEMTPVDFINLKHSVTDNQENFNRTMIHVSVKGNQGVSTKVNILSLNGCKESDVIPFDARNFLKFYCFADSISRQFPLTVVTCYDGANASGLYVATSYLIEKIKLEKAFDVCETVKIVRRNRKQFISEEVQLAFLYEIAMTYIKDLQGYENFSTPLPASNIYHYID